MSDENPRPDLLEQRRNTVRDDDIVEGSRIGCPPAVELVPGRLVGRECEAGKVVRPDAEAEQAKHRALIVERRREGGGRDAAASRTSAARLVDLIDRKGAAHE